MLCGVDQLLVGPLSTLRRRVRSARVGVLTHAASVDRRGRHLLDVLDELGVSARLVFAPEHGLDADAQAEVPIESAADAAAEGGRPAVISLYGKTREELAPRPEHLAEID